MKMDPKLAASKQRQEIKYIAKRFKCPIGIVRQTMLEQGKNGKPARSRRVIYAALRAKGYEVVKYVKEPTNIEG